ncbi:MAG: long-chain fatty acid--CoA ligase [Planctomycetes bacterium]|nr:long-chain fatty acid--CoA ligase [Planctomycetota bacterium]
MTAEPRTIPDLLYAAFDRWPKPDALKVKRDGAWQDIPTVEFERRVAALAHAFAAGRTGALTDGLQPGDRVALISENRPEWTITDLACQTLGLALVPVYPSLPADQVGYILQNSGAKVAIASSGKHLAKIAASGPSCPALKRVVVMDPPPSGESGAPSSAPSPSVSPSSGPPSGPRIEGIEGPGPTTGSVGSARPPLVTPRPTEGGAARGCGGGNVETFDSLLAAGEEKRRADPKWHRIRAAAVTPEMLATLIYTSGTTGTPKGVMLTHANFVANVTVTCSLVDFSHHEIDLSFLPLSHILERMLQYSVLSRGVTIAYAESFEAVAGNLAEVRPMMMAGVPRFFEKLYEKIQGGVAKQPPGKQKIFHWAVKTGKETVPYRLAGRTLPLWLSLKTALARALVFGKIHAKTGGRVRFFLSGGAPLSKEIAEFFWAAGFTVLEGYGLTETTPVIAINTFDHCRLGTVGKPLPNLEVQIAEDGEILVKGPSVMQGYYNLPQETSLALDDGWFHTGDIGHLDPDGFLVITDRKKDLLKTSGGKYVAPQPIENRLKADPLVNMAVVIGNRRKFVSVLIVPAFDRLEAEAKAKGWTFADHPALCAHPEVQKLYESRVAKANEGLASFESVKRCALIPAEFTIEGGELTPTLKVKRRVVEEKYAKEIDRLYAGEGGGE